jgi:hypothetical protein
MQCSRLTRGVSWHGIVSLGLGEYFCSACDWVIDLELLYYKPWRLFTGHFASGSRGGRTIGPNRVQSFCCSPGLKAV